MGENLFQAHTPERRIDINFTNLMIFLPGTWGRKPTSLEFGLDHPLK